MRDRYNETFHMGKNSRKLIKYLLDTTQNEATISSLSQKFNLNPGILKLEIASQIRKIPAFNYDSNEEKLSISEDYVQLMRTIRYSLEQVKKTFYVSRRFEGIIYEKAARSRYPTDFWDSIESLMYNSDCLSSFLFRQFLAYATVDFGPLCSEYIDDTIGWATEIPLNEGNYYDATQESLSIKLETQNFCELLKHVRHCPIFSQELKERILGNDAVQFFELLNLLTFDEQNKTYHVSLPYIYPWNLNLNTTRLVIEEDYCRRVERDFHIELNNPLCRSDFFRFLVNLEKNRDDNTFEANYKLVENLKDFCYNTYSIISTNFGQSDNFDMLISFPVAFHDPNVLGSILWTLERIPRIIELMSFEWFSRAISKAIQTTRLISATTGTTFSTNKQVAIVQSPYVAESIFISARNFGIPVNIEQIESGLLLNFNDRDCRRMGIIQQKEIQEFEQEEYYVEGLACDILNEVLRTRPKVGVLTENLAKKLGVTPSFLRNFVRRYLETLDNELPYIISPKEDPWIRIE